MLGQHLGETWVGIVAYIGAISASGLLSVDLYNKYGISSEFRRKTPHLVMGTFLALAPWGLPSLIGISLVGAYILGVALAFRLGPRMGWRIAETLPVVGRTESFGDLLFPVGLVLTYALTGGDVYLYTVPALVLAYADAAAALVGIRARRFCFRAMGDSKSLQGSLAFAGVAFAVAFPAMLALRTGVGPAATFALSAVLASILTVVEAFSGKGLDNLLIPAAGAAFLAVGG
jgi:phytol kinase